MNALRTRIERLEGIVADRDGAGRFGDWLREMVPGAEVFESELAALALEVYLGALEIAGTDRATALRAADLAILDRARALLRGERGPWPEYYHHGYEHRPVDRQALDDLIARARR